jgi:hypothetical protein
MFASERGLEVKVHGARIALLDGEGWRRMNENHFNSSFAALANHSNSSFTAQMRII